MGGRLDIAPHAVAPCWLWHQLALAERCARRLSGMDAGGAPAPAWCSTRR